MRHIGRMTLIRRDRRDHIELWTLDRPDRLNALPDLEDGEAFAAACEAAGITVRPFAGEGVRITIAEQEANDRVIEVARGLRERLG